EIKIVKIPLKLQLYIRKTKRTKKGESFNKSSLKMYSYRYVHHIRIKHNIFHHRAFTTTSIKDKLYTREYFYWIDKDGKLFLEETKPKIFTTCLKDTRFLNFFSSISKVIFCLWQSLSFFFLLHISLLFWFYLENMNILFIDNKLSIHEEYPYISPCGKEMNFIKCDTSPIVFFDLIAKEASSDSGAEWELIYGGSLRVPFDPYALRVHGKNWKVYHPVPDNVQCNDPMAPLQRYGVIGSDLLLRLDHQDVIRANTSHQLSQTDRTHDIVNKDDKSVGYQLIWNEQSIVLPVVH
ncbi:hypothetical protein RFI_17827, partial [Reticulomyxa filosa]